MLISNQLKEYEQAAVKIAAASLAKKRKVGAVVVAQDGYSALFSVAACNYNPSLNGVCEDLYGNTLKSTIHAEEAAITAFKKQYPNLKPSTIVVTHPPCQNCQALIIAAGITQIHVVEEFLKFDTDKLRYDLVPPETLKALAEVLTYGAKKYKPNNWKNGDKARYVAALYRHLEAWRRGESHDEESGLEHLAHALTNVAFLHYMEKRDEDA